MSALDYRALIILLVFLGYCWFLAKIVARPKPLAKPVKDSKGWLTAQAIFSWLSSFLFGFLTLWILGVIGTTGGWAFLVPVPVMLLVYGAPLLLFALSVRWTRIVMEHGPPLVEI